MHAKITIREDGKEESSTCEIDFYLDDTFWRKLWAGFAMAGACAHPSPGDLCGEEEYAKWAFGIADAMIAESKKGGKEKMSREDFCQRCKSVLAEVIGKVRYVWLAKWGPDIEGEFPTSWKNICKDCLKVYEQSDTAEFRPLKMGEK